MQNAVSLPATEALAGQILSLPCFPGLEDGEIDRVAEAVNEWNDECIR
jgi:dTDP-4-amino-4,6-dideoxygalactose transaminase